MIVKTVNQLESNNLVRDEVNTIMELSSDRSDSATGGFYDNWDDAVLTTNANNSPTPFKLISYRMRIWCNRPCIIWSAVAENLRVAKLSPTGVDTDFGQRSMSNGLIKKWNFANNGGVWSELKARPKGKNGRGPAIMYDATWKLQIKNVDPVPPGDHSTTAAYFGIVEFTIDYDATSTA